MTKKLNLNLARQQKLHFVFFDSLTYKNHLLKNNLIGLKVRLTTCIKKKQEVFLKLLILKLLKKISLKKVKVFFNFHCFYTQTKLPLESRMGKGKGEIITLFGFYQKGYILMNFKNLSIWQAKFLQIHLNKKKIVKLQLVI
nr:Ribosomal protein L16 [Polysiphonia sp.]